MTVAVAGDGALEAPGHRVWLREILKAPPVPPGEPPAGVRSIMKRKEEPADPPAHRRSLQFVGVNGG